MIPLNSVIVTSRTDHEDEKQVLLFSFKRSVYATLFNWLVNKSTEYQSYRP